MNSLQDFLSRFEFWRPLLGSLAVISLFTFILSLALIPWIVGKLPQDCFLTLNRKQRSQKFPSIGHVLWIILRNTFGIILVFAGVIMLFLPGQGLLTILLGALLISFPGKLKLIGSLVRLPKIQHGMDWLRKKRGKPPFTWPKDQESAAKDRLP